MRKRIHLFVMLVIAMSLTFSTTLFAQETDALAWFQESLDNKETLIKIDEDIGSKDAYTVIKIEYPVTIEGNGASTFYGSFIVKSNDVTIRNLKIQNKGDQQGQSTNNRTGIYVYATNVNILNNEFSNGLGDKTGLSNGIQVMSSKKENLFSNYEIKNNTFSGHNNQVPQYASSAIVVAQGYKPKSIDNQPAESIVVSDDDILNIFKFNTFIKNNIDFTHQDWSRKPEEVVLVDIQQADYVEDYKENMSSQLLEEFKMIDKELHQENKEFVEGFEGRMLESVKAASTINEVDEVVKSMTAELSELLSDHELMQQAIADAHEMKTEEHVTKAIDLVNKYHPEEEKEKVIQELELLLDKEDKEPTEEDKPKDDKDKDPVDSKPNDNKKEDKKEVDKNGKSKVPNTGLGEFTTMYLSLITLSLIVIVNLYKRKIKH